MTDAMLIATANCSIGDKKKHLTGKQIADIFLHGKTKNNIEQYIVDTIREEALPQEIEAFAKIHNIPMKQISKVLYANL
ncbi:MAG: hypothetical protein LBJ88_05670 [Campylobacteraceae bacterium]|jgi:hypothetical protein|nr:hypothetical protein [Campylobacteraceae bacterium]